jgi:hypothetical protein
MSASLADLLPAGDGRAGLRVWLKSSAYARRLLLGAGGDPWHSASAYLAWFAQAQGLLKPDVAVLEVGELFESWLARHPGAQAELAGKRKASFPLRKLLEQPAPRALLVEVIAAVLANLRGQVPLVLALPSPRAWLRLASTAAGRDEVEFDADSVEDGAMYMADLARAVSSLEVGGILLDEECAGPGAGPVDLELYRPMLNVAAHYRWPLALRVGPDGVREGAALAELDVLIGASALPAAQAHGCDVSAAVWSGAAPPALAPRQFYFVEIPSEARPEDVLDRLAGLKAAGCAG